MATTRELLERYNPILIMFPQDPDAARPGAKEADANGWGDYHPCPAEFFLARSHLRTTLPGVEPGRVLRRWHGLRRDGIGDLKRQVAQVADPGDTSSWELDVADIESQNEEQAWQVYGDLLREGGDSEYNCATYARAVPGRCGSIALQYWYLYLYNDFWNNHEGDWETVTIEADAGGTAKRVGLSGHFTGTVLPWPEVQQHDGHPVVYVSRGSHAGHFAFNPAGYPADIRFVTRLPWLVEPIWNAVMRLIVKLVGAVDRPPADPELRSGAPVGVRAAPELYEMPGDVDNPVDMEAWWWLRYRGRWGSSRPRWLGGVGVETPWRGRPGGLQGDVRWDDPLGWLDTL